MSKFPGQALHGRGAADNPQNRFTTIAVERDSEWTEEDPLPRTEFLRDSSKTILTKNNSPDIPFEFSVNPYRGCEHGCIYCYARPGHEYLGFSAGLDFETKILVKEDAPALLHTALSKSSWQPRTISISGVTDPYQPVERRLKLTRRILQVLAEFRNPVGIVTKNHLVTRDIDILRELARIDAVIVMLSVTTLEPDLTAILEPRTSRPARRLDAIARLADAGVPVGVMVAPVIPGLTDHETPAILEAAAERGAAIAAYVNLRLPLSLAPLFEQWLDQHFADRKNKVLNRIRSMRGGKINDSSFGDRMRGTGVYADLYSRSFKIHCERLGLNKNRPLLSTDHFRRVQRDQDTLF